MKNIFLILLGVVLLFAGSVAYDMYAAPQFTPVEDLPLPNISEQFLGIVPDFSFETIGGKKVSMKDLRGKPVIINFWATWCPTCLVEFPDMLDMMESYKGDVVLLAISSDYTLDDITKFIAKQSDSMKKTLDSGFVFVTLDENRTITHDLFLTERYPETIIVAPNGEMLRKIVGEFDWKSAETRKYIKGLLD